MNPIAFALPTQRTVASLAIVLSLVLFSSAAAGNDQIVSAVECLHDAQVAQGWIALFDGKSLFGWTTSEPAAWEATSRRLECREPAKPLHTTTRFGKFTLKLEYRSSNAGQLALILSGPSNQDNSPPALVIQLPDSSSHRSEDGEWKKVEVTARRDRVSVKIEDREVANLPRPSQTPVQLGLRVDQGAATFRNLVLKPIGLGDLFNGTDLAGWSMENIGKSRCDVTQRGEMRLRGGEGQVESTDSFGNFLLQCESKTETDGVNSGIFFRAISGSFRKIQGYESQIYNAVDPTAPETPQKFGTGGIYRHQAARRQVARDQQWFAKTIVANGPHFAVWINGLQVTDFTDQRPRAANARQGTRLTPGVIALQGHDPLTDILFRNLRIASFPDDP